MSEQQIVDALVELWIDYAESDEKEVWRMERVLEKVAEINPVAVLFGIANAIDMKPKAEILALLTALSLENLLSYHGPAIIAELETVARQRPLFRQALGLVWKCGMSDDVWGRVVAAGPPRP